MGKILLSIKILIILFLVLFFISGIEVMNESQGENIVIHTFMLIVTGALVIGLSRWWFFSKKKSRKEIKTSTLKDIEELALKEFSDREIMPQSSNNPELEQPKIIINESDTKDYSFDEVKTFVMINGKSLIWQGTTKPTSFRIRDEKDKLYGIFTRLYLYENGEFYLELTDTNTGESTMVAEKEIITAITVGASRYDFKDLCKKNFKLDLHELFEYAKDIRYAAKEIHVVAEFSAIPTTFTYLSNSGKTKRTVDVIQYKRNGYGDEYIAGYCHVRKEHRTFAVGKIQTMLASEGYKKYYFHDWLDNVANIKELKG